jgi:hypothetical protein
VVPIPRFPVLGINTTCVVEIPIEVTPTLFANVGYTTEELNVWLITLKAFTPVKFLPSP